MVAWEDPMREETLVSTSLGMPAPVFWAFDGDPDLRAWVDESGPGAERTVGGESAAPAWAPTGKGASAEGSRMGSAEPGPLWVGETRLGDADMSQYG